MSRTVHTLVLVVALAGSAACAVGVRVQDPYHGDYHRWNGREDRAYRAYLAERHREYVAYARLDARDQQDYWNWRHDHPDHR